MPVVLGGAEQRDVAAELLEVVAAERGPAAERLLLLEREVLAARRAEPQPQPLVVPGGEERTRVGDELHELGVAGAELPGGDLDGVQAVQAVAIAVVVAPVEEDLGEAIGERDRQALRRLVGGVLEPHEHRRHPPVVDRGVEVAVARAVEDRPDLREAVERRVEVAAVLGAELEVVAHPHRAEEREAVAPEVLALGGVEEQRAQVRVDRRGPPAVLGVGEPVDLAAELERREPGDHHPQPAEAVDRPLHALAEVHVEAAVEDQPRAILGLVDHDVQREPGRERGHLGVAEQLARVPADLAARGLGAAEAEHERGAAEHVAVAGLLSAHPAAIADRAVPGPGGVEVELRPRVAAGLDRAQRRELRLDLLDRALEIRLEHEVALAQPGRLAHLVRERVGRPLDGDLRHPPLVEVDRELAVGGELGGEGRERVALLVEPLEQAPQPDLDAARARSRGRSGRACSGRSRAPARARRRPRGRAPRAGPRGGCRSRRGARPRGRPGTRRARSPPPRPARAGCRRGTGSSARAGGAPRRGRARRSPLRGGDRRARRGRARG